MVLRYAKALCKIPRTSGASRLAKAGLMWIGHAEFSFSQARTAPRPLLFAMSRSHSPRAAFANMRLSISFIFLNARSSVGSLAFAVAALLAFSGRDSLFARGVASTSTSSQL
jgi:hypothetical protein